MCGIVGFTGKKPASDVIIASLHALEYRGYDSAGLAVSDGKAFHTIKRSGRVSELQSELFASGGLVGNSGIGHTRWATHGMPTSANAHPHESRSLLLVHNGIIDNYLELRRRLSLEGYTFLSDTDTESAAHLIDSKYAICRDPIRAIFEAASEMTGSFAIGVMFRDIPDRIYAIRRDNPLICAAAEDGAYLASDIPAILPYTRDIYRIKEGEIACLSPDGVSFFSPDGQRIEHDAINISWSVDAASLDGYDFFMQKEIFEQPDAVRRNTSHRINAAGLPDLTADGIPEDFLADIDTVSIIGCGSATHAGLVGKYMLESLAGIPVTVDLASEYRYHPPVTVGRTLAVVISQSGETADTLAALRLAKKNGLASLGIINVVGSAIARESDHVMYTNAGPEIAVATTKGYTTQVATLGVLAIYMALLRGRIGPERARALCLGLSRDIPSAISSVIERWDEIDLLAESIFKSNDLFYIGRGIDHPSGTECSLKLKEISYIHSEAYAAGELKHGTLSLVTEGTPVIALATDSIYYDKMAGNIREVTSRGGYVILVCPDDFPSPEEYASKVFILPKVNPMLSPFLTVVFSQLLAYRVSILRGCDVDHPRNLAKSVTVE